MSFSWERFTIFIRGVLNYRVDEKSLRGYFYLGQEDKCKVVVDTITGGSYGDCTFEQIMEKLWKISRITMLGALEKQILEEHIYSASYCKSICRLYSLIYRTDEN